MIDGATHKAAPPPPGLGWENESIVQVEDFDWREHFRSRGEEGRDELTAAREDGAAAVLRLLSDMALRSHSASGLGSKLVAILIQGGHLDTTFADAARKFGCTKANFSKHACNLRDKFGFVGSNQRAETARENCRRAQINKKPGLRDRAETNEKPSNEKREVNS